MLLINYATPEFEVHRRLLSASAMRFGGFEQVLEYGPDDLDEAFRHRNAETLRQPEGAGNWLWKPYLVDRTLRALPDGEILCYADSSCAFVGSIAPVVDAMRASGADVMAFPVPYVERIWTKRDAFVLMDCDDGRYTETHQVAAGLSLWRKSAFSTSFAHEWLELAQDPRVLTDAPNVCGLPDYPGFQAHRYDQSVFSLLCKKRGAALHRSPTTRPAPAGFPHSCYPRVMVGRATTLRRLAALLLGWPRSRPWQWPLARLAAVAVAVVWPRGWRNASSAMAAMRGWCGRIWSTSCRSP